MRTAYIEVPTAALRIGAAVTILSAVLLPVGFLLHPAGEDATFGTDPLWVPAHAVLWISFGIAPLGWTAVWLGQAAKAGKLGIAGFIVITLGSGFASWIFSSDVAFVPAIAAEAPQLFRKIFTTPHIILGVASVLTWVLGNILFGVSIMRARVYSWWTGLLLIAGTVVIPICYFAGTSVKAIAIAGFIVGIGQAVIGCELWRHSAGIE